MRRRTVTGRAEGAGFPGRHGHRAIREGDVDRVPVGSGHDDPQLIGSQTPLYPTVAAVADREAILGELRERHRIQPQQASPDLQTGQAALDEIEGAGHGAEVDALPRGAALQMEMSPARASCTNVHASARRARASTHPCTTLLSVEP